MLIADIDQWIGKTLFVPPIVKFCQVTRQSQYAVSRLFWFIASLDGFYRAQTFVSAIMFGLLAVVMMLTASLRADTPTRSSAWFRMLAIVLLLLNVSRGAIVGDWLGSEFWVFVLIAEYAATIRTIPPREDEKKAVKTARTLR